MTPADLRERSLKGAVVLLDILEQTRKGRVAVKVERITRVGRGILDTYKLKLSNRLFDEESVFFRDLTTNEEHDSEVVQVKEYDPDKRILVVFVKKKSFTLANKRAEDVVVISDLRFLIERWRKFMEEHGGRLSLPEKSPQLMPPNLPQHATPEQRHAVAELLMHPFSYVWGAPGTGKTRFVLAQVILAYLRAGKRVGIFAPTNLSLEQVLGGVLEVTDEAGIERDVILRLGNPSHGFAETYPEVCELQGTERLLRTTQRQIKVLEDVQEVVSHVEDDAWVMQVKEALPRLEADALERQAMTASLVQARDKYDDVKRQFSRLEAERATLGQRLAQAEQATQGLGQQMKRLFSRQRITKEERHLKTLHDEHRELLADRDLLEANRDRALRDLETLERELDLAEQDWKEQVTFWRNESVNQRDLRELLADIKPGNLTEVLDLVVSTWEDSAEARAISSSIYDEYRDVTADELQERLAILKQRDLRLRRADTEERIKQVQVVAATLDTLVGRFPDADLMVDHFFVDEASYASLGKVLPLFVYHKPVTFLGDHLQLPPVTELEKKHLEMKGNLPAVIWAESALQVGHFFKENLEQLAQKFFFAKETRQPGIPQVNLTRTHRFGPSLASILDRFVYKNDFGSALSEGEDTGIFLLQVDKTTRRKQRSNPAEVRAIQHLLPRLLKKEMHDFAIVAPYTKQIDALRRELPEVYDAERILTVHKSQGREWDYVIFSICDTDDAYFVDSLKPHTHGLNLLNTAISRTRKGLILVGDIYYWREQKGQLLAELARIGREIR